MARASGDALANQEMADGSKLSYNLDKLTWDTAHHFNSQNRYSYTGKGRKLGDAMLQCETCMQWFHAKDVSCLTERDRFVAFQRNYRFCCRICSGGSEQFSLLTNTWSCIVLTALHNLQLPLDMKNGEVVEVATKLADVRRWVPLDEVVQWIRDHWGSLCHGRSQAQLDEGNAARKCLAHMDGVGAGVGSVSGCRGRERGGGQGVEAGPCSRGERGGLAVRSGWGARCRAAGCRGGARPNPPLLWSFSPPRAFTL